MKYISLYSGCGGLDYGFHEAGFNLVFANDIDKDSCITFEDNFSFEPRNYDLNKISLKEIPKADIVIGGPPCQSFSFLGKRAIFDERGKEIFNFFKVVEKVRPKIFLMENVPGVRASSINNLGLIDYLSKEMKKIGYQTSIFRFDCTKIYIPQTRKRDIFIGWQKPLKAPMELDNISLRSLFEINSNKNFVTINDCLSDIGKPTLDDDFQFYKNRAESDYQKYLRNNSKKFNHHFLLKMSDKEKDFIKFIPPGGNYKDIPDEISTPRILRIKKTGGRTTTYGRLHPEKFSATINTYFNRPNVGTNFHHEVDRLITPREALRIQSFPDNFVISYSSKRSLFRQIGNAVPPRLSSVLTKMVIDMNNG